MSTKVRITRPLTLKCFKIVWKLIYQYVNTMSGPKFCTGNKVVSNFTIFSFTYWKHYSYPCGCNFRQIAEQWVASPCSCAFGFLNTSQQINSWEELYDEVKYCLFNRALIDSICRQELQTSIKFDQAAKTYSRCF